MTAGACAPPVTMIVLGDEIAFPVGGASSAYIGRLARAVVGAGGRSVVMCLDYSERGSSPQNTVARGEERGVSFEYTTGDPVLPARPWNISLGRARAALSLASRLDAYCVPGHTVAVYYGRYPSVLARLRRLCRARAIPLVASVVEWRLSFAGQTLAQRLGDRLFHRMLPSLDASIVISRFIERAMRDQLHATHPILRVPLLAEPEGWRAVEAFVSSRPYAVFCADFDSYPEDAKLVIEALARVPELDLHLIGKAVSRREELLALASRLGSAERVRLEPRFVPEPELRARYAGASVLLAPMRDDARSRARFPSKIADYLLAGRVVVSSAVGEVGEYLTHRDSALFCAPGDVDSLVAAVREAIGGPDREAIALRGRRVAEQQFDVAVQGPLLAAWLANLAASKRQARSKYT